MGTASKELVRLFNLQRKQAPIFFRSLDDVNRFAGKHPYSHIMRRAWEEMELDGIYCVNGRPTVYFKEVGQNFNESTLRRLHEKLWNQGSATTLIISAPTEVHVFSALAYPARKQENVAANERLVEVLERTKDSLELGQLVLRIETGQYYQDHKKSFDSSKTVDRSLLDNLSATRDQLCVGDSGLDFRTAHTLLGRIIFACYLIDRQIIGATLFESINLRGVRNLKDLFDAGNTSTVDRALSRLFTRLQKIFNGSLFDDRQVSLTSSQINVLRSFLAGEDVDRKQITFDFWVYDFSVIPIETISALYENFISAEDSEEQKRSGAYYTPRHLAEMVVDVAMAASGRMLDKKFLDPSCGSGIFLVILFNRLAEAWRAENPRVHNTTRAKALIDILTKRLCGVDKNATACRITCFSLYLALLDQLKPRDIIELREERGTVLPRLMGNSNERMATGSRVIVHGDFFDPDIELGSDFDLVIGNPPWVSRGSDTTAHSWCMSDKNPFLEDAPQSKHDRTRYFMPARQLANAFMWKAPLHVRPTGSLCLLLPSKVLLNKTDEFQRGWFSHFSVERVILLSDLRFVLFEHAICPALIALYRPGIDNDEEHRITYDSPKFDRSDPRRGVIEIEPDDSKEISVSKLLQAADDDRAPVIWKTNFWGTPRDQMFLDRLLRMPSLGDAVGRPTEAKRWIRGQGFKPFHRDRYDRNPEKYGEPKIAWWSSGQLYINAKNKDTGTVLLAKDCELAGDRFDKLHRSPNKSVFQPPMVIANQGFSRCLFTDFSVVFQHSFQSISGPKEDSNLLKLLTCILNSSLGTYFLFHTASNWGTERDKVLLFELMRLPFPFPHDLNDFKRSQSIVDEAAILIDNLKGCLENTYIGRANVIAEAKDKLDDIVFSYFEISDWEKTLIVDTVNVFEPSSTPASLTTYVETLKKTSTDDRKIYSDNLCSLLNTWSNQSAVKVSGRTLISDSLGLGIFTLCKSSKEECYKEEEAPTDLQNLLGDIRRTLAIDEGRISRLRGLKVFIGEELHILKPLNLRHWTRTAALNDADEIAAAILEPGRTV